MQFDPAVMRDAMKKFDELDKKLAELRIITRDDAGLKQLDQCRTAGKAYGDGMASFLENWLAREELGKKRTETADAVLLLHLLEKRDFPFWLTKPSRFAPLYELDL